MLPDSMMSLLQAAHLTNIPASFSNLPSFSYHLDSVIDKSCGVVIPVTSNSIPTSIPKDTDLSEKEAMVSNEWRSSYAVRNVTDKLLSSTALHLPHLSVSQNENSDKELSRTVSPDETLNNSDLQCSKGKKLNILQTCLNVEQRVVM